MDLAEELAAFDGKHNDTLEALAAKLTPAAPVVAELCALSRREDPKLQTAATWLLKRFQEEGLAFSAKQVEVLLDLFEAVTHWEAQLHLLQMLPGLTIPAARAAPLFSRLKGEDFLQAANKFVRAWSYNGLAVLASQHEQFRPIVTGLLKAGQEEEAASVRARIRNAIKAAPWVESERE